MGYNRLIDWSISEYHKMMTDPLPKEWPTGILKKLNSKNMDKNARFPTPDYIKLEQQGANVKEEMMADLPVTVQLTYGDLKLLEWAKEYVVKSSFVMNFIPESSVVKYNKDFILAEVRKERKVVSSELWEDHDQLNMILPYIDRLIQRIEQFP